MEITAKLQHGFLLGEHIVEPRIGAVIADGQIQKLPPISMTLLVLLAERQGEVVTRDEIIGTIWANDGASHQTLARHISEIRSCLHDDARHPTFIQTVPRCGYRLLSAVIAEDDFAAEPEEAHATTPMPKPTDERNDGRFVSFLGELRKRKVVRASLIYVLVVWGVLQVGEIVFPALGVPDWALTFVVLLGVLGFPITLVLAWAFDLTPGGLQLDIPMSYRRKDPPNRRLHLLVISSLLLVVFILAGQVILQAKAGGNGVASVSAERCDSMAAMTVPESWTEDVQPEKFRVDPQRGP